MSYQRTHNAIVVGQHYLIRREIGSGSMAVVYQAEDRRSGEEVALKLLPPELLGDLDMQEQFEENARLLMALEHPGIVPVLDFGEHAGQPFLVMPYMGGVPLSGQLELGALSLAEAASYVAQIAPALHHAHSCGVIHRDLKPSNVLFDEEGHPALSDFTLVRFARPFAQVSGVAVVGSAAYIAPEVGQPSGVTPLVDVYALGVMLYQMLAGHLPYRASSPVEMLRAHIEAPIPNLRAVRPDLPESIQQVIIRALAKDPLDRYQNALELQEDLELVVAEAGVHHLQWDVFRAGGPGLDGEAGEYGEYDTVPDWQRAGEDPESKTSTPTGTDPVAAAEAEVEGAFAKRASARRLSLRERWRLRRAERRALGRWRAAQARRAGAAELVVRLAGLAMPPVLPWIAVGVLIALFVIWFEISGVVGAVAAAFQEVETPVPTPSPTPLPTPQPTPNPAIFHLAGHTQAVTVLAFDPAGSRLASGGADGQVVLWDAASGGEIARLGRHEAAITSLAFSADGTRLASGGADGSVLVWNVISGARERALSGHSRAVNAVNWSPSGRWLASGGDDGVVVAWDTSAWGGSGGEGDSVRWLDARSGPVTALAFHPEGQLAAGTGDQIIFWNVAAGQEVRRLPADGQVRALAFSASGDALAVGTDAGFSVIDALSGAVRESLPGVPFVDAAWSPDGARLATAAQAPEVLVWDLASGVPVRQFSGHEAGVISVAWDPEGRWLATGSQDGMLIVWDLGLGSEAAPDVPVAPIGPDRVPDLVRWRDLNGHVDVIRALSFSPDGRQLASGSQDGRLLEWSVPGGYAFPLLAQYNRWVTAAAFHPTAPLLAASGSDGTSLVIWHATTRQGIYILGGHAGGVTGAAWSPDGTLLAVGSQSGVVYIYQVTLSADGTAVEDAAQIYQLLGHEAAANRVAFGPGGVRLATLDGGDPARLIVWDVEEGTPLNEFEVNGPASDLAWSPDGRLLAIAQAGAVGVWDARSGGDRGRYPAQGTEFRSVAWSPDGVIAAGTTVGTVVLFDAAASGEAGSLAVLEGHTSPVTALRFSTDGALLASGSSTGMIQVWGVQP